MAGFAAIDLGASSGRVMRADVSPAGVRLHEVHRFVNRPVRVAARLHWDVLSLWDGTKAGLRAAARAGDPLVGVAVDSWAIDYALLDADGRLLGNPVHYRDTRTDGVAERVAVVLDPAVQYARTGVQVLPFNTVYQFVADLDSTAMQHAAHALLIPDLFGFWLTGERATELTNASTTGLVDVRARRWSSAMFADLGLRADLFPAVREPGAALASVSEDVARECELGVMPSVSLVGSHDTASAVAGVPARDENFAYISCGTWSLVGVELDSPVTTEAARAANFSNELGVDGTVRFLRNVMGLWLLQECVRTWERTGSVDLGSLLAEAARVPGGRSVLDPDRPEFLAPGDMPTRLQDECRRTGQPVPETRAQVTRCILDSLAAAYRRVVHQAAALSGASVRVVHLVGGGAQNALLCQLAADACELPVVAGPVEAAAYGNVLLQARTAGVLDGDLARLRSLLVDTQTRTFHPQI